MAVYTHVSDRAAEAFLRDFELGSLVALEGISDGVENTNYRLTTERGVFIFTLFEKRVREADLPFFLNVMAHVASKGLAAPKPVSDRAGTTLKSLCDRPAVITTFIPGAPHMTPSLADCNALGDVAARLHQAVADFTGRRDNALGLEGWRRLAETCIARADERAAGLGALIADELEFLSESWPQDLPYGVVHADLFPDNVFFEHGRLSGVIDFYFSCTDFFAYDLAICLNAWASDGGNWVPSRAAAIIDGYCERRPLSPAERAALPVLLRGASLRFLLTRLHDWLHQVDGAMVTVKDPLEYRDLLEHHRAVPHAIVEAGL